jgi:hypothetical protein
MPNRICLDETQSTPSPPQAIDCLVPDMQFMSKYALPVSQTKGMLKNMLTKDLTATVFWLRSVPWLDLVGLVGVGLVGVGFYILARVVSVGLWELACRSGLVGVGLWQWARGHRYVECGSWEWVCGQYFVGVDSWALICGIRLVGVVRPGLGGKPDNSTRGMLHSPSSRLQL